MFSCLFLQNNLASLRKPFWSKNEEWTSLLSLCRQENRGWPMHTINCGSRRKMPPN